MLKPKRTCCVLFFDIFIVCLFYRKLDSTDFVHTVMMAQRINCHVLPGSGISARDSIRVE